MLTAAAAAQDRATQVQTAFARAQCGLIIYSGTLWKSTVFRAEKKICGKFHTRRGGCYAQSPAKKPEGVADQHPAGHAQGCSRNAKSLQWDDIIVLFFALLGFVGSVVLYVTASAPPIIVSIFLASGVSSLVYRFLGGIQVAEFAWGTLRVTGTLAALVGIAVGVNKYLEVQTLALLSLEGRYEWQYAAEGWKGYINVEKDGSASIYMQRYTTCGGAVKPLPLLQQSVPGTAERKQGQTEMHVSIPVQFINYDAHCNATGLAEPTVLTGDLFRTTAFLGTIEYRSKYGVPLGGMILVKDPPATMW